MGKWGSMGKASILLFMSALHVPCWVFFLIWTLNIYLKRGIHQSHAVQIIDHLATAKLILISYIPLKAQSNATCLTGDVICEHISVTANHHWSTSTHMAWFVHQAIPSTSFVVLNNYLNPNKDDSDFQEPNAWHRFSLGSENWRLL